MDEDPRVKETGQCGVTIIGGTGIEWICIREVHAKIYQGRSGELIFDNNPNADRHYCVNRWPGRKRENDDLPESTPARERT